MNENAEKGVLYKEILQLLIRGCYTRHSILGKFPLHEIFYELVTFLFAIMWV